MKTLWLVAGVAGLWGSIAWGQSAPGPYTWEEFAKRIKSSEKVEPLGPNFAGEQVSLSNGGLSFSATDVSLPGNNALKVEFRRTYSVFSRKDYRDLGMLADWVVDLPSISGVFAPDWVGGTEYSTDRCTSGSLPRVSDPVFDTEDFWQGIQINIPGVTSSELLRTQPIVDKPTDGPTYYWVTNEHVHVSCLSTIKNPGTGNGTGQGFLARTPDGTRYWFDWMGQTYEPKSGTLIHEPDGGVRTWHTLDRTKNYLYVTRVEDRFGNYVEYRYGNAWNEPGKLTKIEASDGRSLTISYSGAKISSVTDGARTWNYAYELTSSGRNTLKSVTLPDNSAWAIDLGAFTSAEIKFYESPPVGEPIRSCFMNEEPLNGTESFVGRIAHPAGATSEFTLDIREHGRSWVPVSCRNVLTTFLRGHPKAGWDNITNDDVNLWATSAYSLTLKRKRVYGPGLQDATWDYTYEPNFGPLKLYDGVTGLLPVCPEGVDCSQPPCTNDSCAKYSVTTVSGPGEWQRYRHGNTYRYNEGKLLQVETGTGPAGILRVQNHTYDLSQLDKVYPARFGHSRRIQGEGFATEYHRPETSTEIRQQGTTFKRVVDEFDEMARSKQVTRSSSASGVSDPPPPGIGAPTLTAPSNAVAGQLHVLSWASVSGAVLYVLERSIDSGAYATIYSGAATRSEMTFATVATLKYRLRACNAYGQCSTYSAVKTVAVSAPISLGTPTLTAASSATVGNPFDVSWTAVPGADKYIMERRIGATGSYLTNYNGTGTSKATSYSSPVTLYFRVKACDATNNCGSYSNIDSTVVTDDMEP